MGRELGARVPRGPRQLLSWHNGERGDGGDELFEIGNQSLEGIATIAPSLTELLAPAVSRLERGEATFAMAKDKPRQEVDAARLLVEGLVASKMLEVEDGAADALAGRLRPLLARKPKRRAVEAALALFGEDDAVLEIFAPDEALATLIEEFVG